MKITMINVHELFEYDNNPRDNDEAVDIVAKSIGEFGFKVSIILVSLMLLLQAKVKLNFKKLGIKEVPC